MVKTKNVIDIASFYLEKWYLGRIMGNSCALLVFLENDISYI